MTEDLKTCPHCHSKLSKNLNEAMSALMESKKSFRIQCKNCSKCLMQMGYCAKCDFWNAYLGGGLNPGKGGPCGRCSSLTLPPKVQGI